MFWILSHCVICVDSDPGVAWLMLDKEKSFSLTFVQQRKKHNVQLHQFCSQKFVNEKIQVLEKRAVLWTEGVPEIWFSVSRISRKMGLRQVEQGFSSFLATFLMIFQSSKAPSMSSTLKNNQKWQKNEEKPCSTWVQGHLQNPKSYFWKSRYHT